MYMLYLCGFITLKYCLVFTRVSFKKKNRLVISIIYNVHSIIYIYICMYVYNCLETYMLVIYFAPLKSALPLLTNINFFFFFFKKKSILDVQF